jgi:hypothetical protein
MFNPLSVEVAEISRRERLDEAKSRQMSQQGTASHPIELSKYIKAFLRQLPEQLQKAENRAGQGEATPDHGLP